MVYRDTSVSVLCSELEIKPVTLYRSIGLQGELREQGRERSSPLEPGIPSALTSGRARAQP